MFGTNNFQQGIMPATANSFGFNNGFGGFGGYGLNVFPQNNGLAFGNVPNTKQSTSTPEEMAIIKANKSEAFTVSPEEMAKFTWDLRDGSTLALEIVDPTTDRVRIKYTNEEFNIVSEPVESLKTCLDIVDNFVKTTAVLNTTDSGEAVKELLGSWGVVKKLLPIGYSNGLKNYGSLTQSLQNQLMTQGYQGVWGGNPYNGAIGSVPNYEVNQNPYNMFQGGMMSPQNFAYQQAAMMQQNMMQNPMQAAMMQQNPYMTPQINGGTMLNAFTQGGVPQVVGNATTPVVTPPTPAGTTTPPTPATAVPQISMANIPQPNATAAVPGQGTPNPSIGATNTVQL